jgi:hypothetical protein
MMTDHEPVFQTGNSVIENTRQWLRLGNPFTSQFAGSTGKANRRSCFVGQVNDLLCNFSAINLLTLNQLFFSYCCMQSLCMGESCGTCKVHDLNDVLWGSLHGRLGGGKFGGFHVIIIAGSFRISPTVCHFRVDLFDSP